MRCGRRWPRALTLALGSPVQRLHLWPGTAPCPCWSWGHGAGSWPVSSAAELALPPATAFPGPELALGPSPRAGLQRDSGKLPGSGLGCGLETRVGRGCRLAAEDRCLPLLCPPRGLLLAASAASAAVWLPLVEKQRMALGQRTTLLRPPCLVPFQPPRAGGTCRHLFPGADGLHAAHSLGLAIGPAVPQMARETGPGEARESRGTSRHRALRQPRGADPGPFTAKKQGGDPRHPPPPSPQR